MKTQNAPINVRILLAVAIATVLIAGCKSDRQSTVWINDQFEPDNAPRATHNIFEQQTRIGARQDGTLYASHFTDGELNSLGVQKLDLATAGPERGVVNIYLSIPKDNAYAARESSVIAFLSNKGLASNSYTLNAGDNPGLGTPAVQGLNGLAKQAESSGGEENSIASGGKK